MKRRFLSMFLAMALCLGVTLQAKASAATAEPTPQQVYQSMIALQAQYPEGMSWTNSVYRAWQGGIFAGGYGCAGFAFMLSDAAFGSLPARRLTQFAFSDVRVGDILRLDNDTHTVIVLEVHGDHVVIAEGNYNYSVHWGRKLTSSEVLSASYMITRYPENAPVQTPDPVSSFTDTPSWCAAEAQWAVEQEITNGYGGNDKFAPNNDCTVQEILTFLWRAEGKHIASAKAPFTVASWYQDAVDWAYSEGLIDAQTNPAAPCTRAQAVTFIWKARGELKATKTASFPDVSADDSYAAAVDWASEKGVTKSYGGTGNFAPDRVCNRGQIACFLHRAYN